MPSIIDNAAIDALLVELNTGVPEAEHLVLDASRRAAIQGYDNIHACPGAGKTTLVGLKLILLAQTWSARNQGVCVLTHTNVAKEEILARVRTHPTGARLLSYPHFIGTIQDFVHTFLALPACRSEGLEVRRVDDKIATAVLERRLAHGTRTYLAQRHADVSELRYVFRNGELTLNVPGFAAQSTSPSYVNLEAAKGYAVANGYFFFSEMYAFANQVLQENSSLIAALRNRFPIVLVDEMQDTQKFQDELINRLFHDAPGVALQKVGDPDQSIFDGMASDEPNESYNTADLAPIVDSSRFSPGIAAKLRGLSTRGIALTGTRAEVAGCPASTIILYDGATIGGVLARFAEIVAELEPEQRRSVKAVGGVAQNAPGANDPLNVQSYWPAYERGRSVRAASPETFCAAVRFCAELEVGNVHARYGVLLQSVVELLRLAGKTVLNRAGTATPIVLSNLSRFMRGTGKAREFRTLMAELVMQPMPSPEAWPPIVQRLGDCCGLNINAGDVSPYLAYAELEAAQAEPAVMPGNVFLGANGVAIEVSTIHGVKGETHDATLVLETRYKQLFDVQEMLPFLLDEAAAKPVFDPQHSQTHASIRASFMKKLYVAASRPRHVVCIAVHKDRITEQQRADLQLKGWALVSLE